MAASIIITVPLEAFIDVLNCLARVQVQLFNYRVLVLILIPSRHWVWHFKSSF